MKKQGGGASLPTVQSFRSHSPYTLPSSVSCKSFPCHSYANSASDTVLRDENCRGMYPKFPIRKSFLATRHPSLATGSERGRLASGSPTEARNRLAGLHSYRGWPACSSHTG